MQKNDIFISSSNKKAPFYLAGDLRLYKGAQIIFSFNSNYRSGI